MGASFVLLAQCCKCFNVVLHVLVLAVGLYTHIFSSWRGYIHSATSLKLYQVCYYDDISKDFRKVLELYEDEVTIKVYFNDTSCPKLWLEEYFAAVIVATFLASLISIKVFSDTDARLRRLMAIVYYRFAAVLLISAAVVYAFSTVQIRGLDLYAVLLEMNESAEGFFRTDLNLNFMFEAKLLAVALTILLALGHVVYSIIAQKSDVADFSAS